jgi:hypothetical protein
MLVRPDRPGAEVGMHPADIGQQPAWAQARLGSGESQHKRDQDDGDALRRHVRDYRPFISTCL